MSEPQNRSAASSRDETDAHRVSPSEIQSALLDEFMKPDYRVPVLPSVAVELLQLIRKANVGVREIVQLLEHDQFLASEVLRLAHSASFGGGAPLRSLEEAIIRVGLRRTDQLVMRAALESRVFKSPTYAEHMERLRGHSVATAEIARLACRQTSLFDEYVYLCGLLHDVGIATCLVLLGEGVMGMTPSFESAWPAVRRVHAANTQVLAVVWKLPEEIRLILEHHHNLEAQHPLNPVAALTYLAEVLASRLGCGFEDEQSEANIQIAVDALSLTGRQLQDIREAAERLVRTL